ncbi:MAG TPA: hypothetical protein QGG18_08760 [Rhodospirillales bacterium]|nr:hypothetical protein [Rhodospirillales bacterium]
MSRVIFFMKRLSCFTCQPACASLPVAGSPRQHSLLFPFPRLSDSVPVDQLKSRDRGITEYYVLLFFNYLIYRVAFLFFLHYNFENEQRNSKNGSRTMFRAMKENSGLDNGFAKEFAALSSLCAAGYLWLLLI